MDALVTGGAGFIGSHLVEALISKGYKVLVLDNLKEGRLENLRSCLSKGSLEFVKADLLDERKVLEAVKGKEVVWHLAANPEVRSSAVDPRAHFRENIQSTFNLLEALRKGGCVKKFGFTSTSTVYGEASQVPTAEWYAPLDPISMYGASKLACEALISAFSHTYGFDAVHFRLANIVGPRSRHGVIYDFISKLKQNPYELEVLGDGSQKKSYLYVKDCIEAMLLGFERSRGRVDFFNVGSEDQIDVEAIAKIVIGKMGLKNVVVKFTGGVDGGRGWVGDVKVMLLDIGKLKSLGWRPTFNSYQTVERATEDMVEELSSDSQ